MDGRGAEGVRGGVDGLPQLATANSDTYLPYVARTLGGMGRMHASMNQAGEARRAFREALEILEKFAVRDPAQYQPFVNAVKASIEKVKREARHANSRACIANDNLRDEAELMRLQPVVNAIAAHKLIRRVPCGTERYWD